jgi:hypothetical protein
MVEQKSYAAIIDAAIIDAAIIDAAIIDAAIKLNSRGAAKKKMTKVTYICRSAKKKVVTYKKCGFFFLRVFFFTLGCFVRFFFNRVFGRFVTRGVQKRDKKKSRENLLSSFQKKELTYLRHFFFFLSRPPLLNFFLKKPKAPLAAALRQTANQLRKRANQLGESDCKARYLDQYPHASRRPWRHGHSSPSPCFQKQGAKAAAARFAQLFYQCTVMQPPPPPRTRATPHSQIIMADVAGRLQRALVHHVRT